METVTEQEAMNKVQVLVLGRRKYLGISDHSYCTKCQKLDARYLTTSIMDGSSECEECFIKRKYKELSPQITEEDSKGVKEQRAQFVKEYFTKKKHEFNQ